MDTEIFYDLVYLSLKYLDNYKNILTIMFSVCFGALLFIGINPLTTKEDAPTGEKVFAAIRRVMVLIVLVVTPLIYLYVYIFSQYVTGDKEYFKYFLKTTVYGFKGAWAFYAAIVIGALTLRFTAARVIEPYVSYLIRKYRVKQNSGKLSDIRTEFETLKSKNYDPRKYFKEGYMFLGLDENNKPIYETDDDFKSRHIKIVGPTQTGKGVIQGLIIYQSIMKGWITGFFDIKPDDYIYSIMCKACKDFGRPEPIVVDLNGIGPGSYNMFTNGNKRDILSRIQAAVNVNEKGTNADFYNANERSLMIDIQEHFDGNLKTLEQLLLGNLPSGEKKPEYYEITQKSRAYVKEMKSHKPLNPKKGRGFNIDKTLETGAVFYIRGSITDKLVKKAQTIMLMDMIQSVLRIGKQDKHFYLAIDEVKFIVSDMLSTGLSTVLSKGMNISVAYQTRSNLMSLEDTTLNAKAIASEVEVNTLTTLTYKAADDETAKWAAGLTGTINKAVVRSEGVEYGKLGAEKYTGQKQVHYEQEELIPMNRMKRLPRRTGVLIRPDSLAQIIHTCWIPLEKHEFRDIAKKDNSENKKTTELDAITIADEKLKNEDFENSNREEDIIIYSRTENKNTGKKSGNKKRRTPGNKEKEYTLKDFMQESGLE